jgi:hypothetical protein
VINTDGVRGIAQDGKNGSRPQFACHHHLSAHHLRKLPRDGKTEARYTVLP